MTRFLIALVATVLIPGAASAADFRLGGDESVGCRMSIEGEIVTGDAERFRDMLVAYIETVVPKDETGDHSAFFDDYPHEIRICLDSPGGSFAEAMEMADTLAYAYRVQSDIAPRVPGLAGDIVWMIGTAVPAGARCEGACAILFMAGGHFSHLGTSDNVRDPNRVLHVDGRLVFRVPGPDALATLQRIGARLDRYIVPPSLFQRIMAASPDGMVPVDTVEQAASWVIQLAGAPLIADPSLGNLGRVCATISALSQPGMPLGAQYSVHGAPAEIRAGITPMFGLQPQIGVARSQDWRFGTADREDEVLRGTIRHDSFACSFDYDAATGAIQFLETPPADHGLVRGAIPALGPATRSGGWMLFPGYTPLAELSALARAHPDGRVPGDTLMGPVTDRLRGWCATYDANDLLVRSDTCEATLSSRQRADQRGYQEQLVVAWRDGQAPALPSGLEGTEGQRMGDWQHLGTGLAGRVWDGERGHAFEAPVRLQEDYAWVGGCYRNLTTGQTRCFVIDDVVVEDLSAFRR